MIRLMIGILAIMVSDIAALEVPDWVKRGILSVESSSYYADEKIVWVDRRRGAIGERGPFQMTRAAWVQIKSPGESFDNLETDLAYAEECAMRYLQWLHKLQRRPTWETTVQYYNAGPRKRSTTYLRLVRRAGGK